MNPVYETQMKKKHDTGLKELSHSMKKNRHRKVKINLCHN